MVQVRCALVFLSLVIQPEKRLIIMNSSIGNYKVVTQKAQAYRGFKYQKRGTYYSVTKLMDAMPSDLHRSRCSWVSSTVYRSVSRIKQDVDQWYIDVEETI